MKQTNDRVSSMSTSSAGSGSMLGHVTTIVVDGSPKSSQGQVRWTRKKKISRDGRVFVDFFGSFLLVVLLLFLFFERLSSNLNFDCSFIEFLISNIFVISPTLL